MRVFTEELNLRESDLKKKKSSTRRSLVSNDLLLPWRALLLVPELPLEPKRLAEVSPLLKRLDPSLEPFHCVCIIGFYILYSILT